ncbi:MAG: hypothetical protein ABSE45_17245 [Candidatus Acidiferrales bacterium]
MLPEDVSSHLEQLSARVKELERRISALEHPWQIHSPHLEPPAAPATAGLGSGEALAAQPQPGVFSVFGRAVLGIAGAYLLRAAAESGIFPLWIAVTLALCYAAAWLAWAAWPGPQTRLVRYSYAITAALILSPLLWEVTVRFRMIEPRVAAAVLAAFALLAMTLAWRRNVSPVIWVGMLTAVITALILMAATRAPVPFTLALLVMALLSEFAASQGRWSALRPVVATAADFATLILIIILGNYRAIPPEYHPVAAGVMVALVAALFAIYAVSLAARSLSFRLKITGFEAAQLAATVLLACWGIVRITRGAGLPALGVTCLIAGAACYFAAFGLLPRHRERPNFHFYAAFGVAFVMAGGFFALPSLPLVIWLCLASVIATGMGVRLRSPALDLHGVVYLSGAVFASGLLEYAGRALAGTYPPAPGALPIVAAVAALLCTVMVSRYPGERWGERLLRLLPAILAVYALAALAVAALVWLIARGAAPALPQLAVIRTIVTCAAALLLAFVGARWKRLELVWMAYAAAVLGSLKLIFEDLRFGSTQSLAASLLVYGTVLILIPRLVRAGRRWA